jgi:hypothetical protein
VFAGAGAAVIVPAVFVEPPAFVVVAGFVGASILPAQYALNTATTLETSSVAVEAHWKSRFRSQYYSIWKKYELRNMFHELENNCTLETSLGSNSQTSPTHETVCKREMCSENLLTWYSTPLVKVDRIPTEFWSLVQAQL